MLSTLGLTERFNTLVIAEDLAQAKPHPMPYLESHGPVAHFSSPGPGL